MAKWLRALIFHYRLIIRSSHRCIRSRSIRGTCETSQVLTAGVPGGFSRGSPVFAQSTDLSVSYELKFLCCLHFMCVFKYLVKFG